MDLNLVRDYYPIDDACKLTGYSRLDIIHLGARGRISLGILLLNCNIVIDYEKGEQIEGAGENGDQVDFAIHEKGTETIYNFSGLVSLPMDLVIYIESCHYLVGRQFEIEQIRNLLDMTSLLMDLEKLGDNSRLCMYTENPQAFFENDLFISKKTITFLLDKNRLDSDEVSKIVLLDDFDKKNYPIELEFAIRAWRSVTSSEAKGKPKGRIRKWLDENTDLSNEAKERISIVANWDKLGGATRSD